jgi:predicted ester cyclase
MTDRSTAVARGPVPATAGGGVAANQALIRRVFDEIVNGRDLDLLALLYRPDMIDHDPLPGAPDGVAGVRHTLGSLQAAFSDLQVTINAMSAYGDKVVIHNTWTGTHDGRLLGLPPTGRRTAYDGVVIFRIADGLVAERWALVDTDRLARQLEPTAQPRRRPAASPPASSLAAGPRRAVGAGAGGRS